MEKLVVLNLDGNVVEGTLKPSSDTKTHLVLYKNFLNIGGIVHTHSPWATIWAQAGLNIPVFGTTHADYFNDAIPCTRPLTVKEIENDYELETGNVIVETLQKFNVDELPSVLVHGHAPFNWGNDALKAVQNAVVLEQCAKMALFTKLLNPNSQPIDELLLSKHFYRKHGSNAYYGQQSKGG